ncbi:hypothetical protein KY358_06415 [Candidatus Woesearchaeota archaeon]|nr:hypothetical protein [Candidatus Woesearchaeota archaeon]
MAIETRQSIRDFLGSLNITYDQLERSGFSLANLVGKYKVGDFFNYGLVAGEIVDSLLYGPYAISIFGVTQGEFRQKKEPNYNPKIANKLCERGNLKRLDPDNILLYGGSEGGLLKVYPTVSYEVEEGSRASEKVVNTLLDNFADHLDKSECYFPLAFVLIRNHCTEKGLVAEELPQKNPEFRYFFKKTLKDLNVINKKKKKKKMLNLIDKFPRYTNLITYNITDHLIETEGWMDEVCDEILSTLESLAQKADGQAF